MSFQLQTEQAADVIVQGHGSIVLLWPRTAAACAWCDEHLEIQNRWGNGIVCEPRYVSPVIEALERDGFTVA